MSECKMEVLLCNRKTRVWLDKTWPKNWGFTVLLKRRPQKKSWPGKDMLCIYVRRSGTFKRRRSVDDNVVSVTVNLLSVRRIQHGVLKQVQNYSTTGPPWAVPPMKSLKSLPCTSHSTLSAETQSTEVHRVQRNLPWAVPPMKNL